MRRRRSLGSHESDDLRTFIANEHDLWLRKKAIQVTLTRHACRGVFDKTQAAKGFSYVTAEAGKRYANERGQRGSHYPKSLRDEADRELVAEYLTRLRMCREQGHCGDLPEAAVALLRKPTCRPGPKGQLSGAGGRRRRRG